MVRIFDDSGEFDVPIDVLWAYLEAPGKHRAAHKGSIRNIETKKLSDRLVEMSMEQVLGGSWVRTSGYSYSLKPLGEAAETLVGPTAGSKQLVYYTPKGNKTRVTIVGEFVSSEMSEDKLKESVVEAFDTLYEQDRAAIREFASNR